jgi:hypothetical protein
MGGRPVTEQSRRDGDSGIVLRAPDERVLTPAVLLVRFKRGIVGESRRTVHIVPTPSYPEITALKAHCGQEFRADQAELVGKGQGMPCEWCLSRAPVPEPDDFQPRQPKHGETFFPDAGILK